MSKVANNEESFQLMKKVGPRVCITTATHPGFVGFQANIQTGILPLAGRYGGGKVHMEKELNPIRNYQYTMWKRWQDHDDFHLKQFDRTFELCGSCLSMVIEGPWEPVYRIVKAKMPPVRSMGQITDLGIDMKEEKEFIRFVTPRRCVAMAEHTVKPLIHSEWDAAEMAQLGFAKVFVNHRIRKIHDDGVMAHLMRGPYIMFFQPMMEEPGWRSMLT
jgi:sulfur oxygenase/reductase